MSQPDTRRLRLFQADDFDAFHALVSDFDVVKTLGSWPHPADPEFTKMRINTPEAQSGQVNVIECDGRLAGSIGFVHGEIGYMLSQDFWGRGLATWAVGEKLTHGFTSGTDDLVEAGAYIENPASAAVLLKNGFKKTGSELHYCKARDGEFACDMYTITRATWAKRQPLLIETDRLRIEPFTEQDAAELSALMDDEGITRMMSTIPQPFGEDEAKTWIAERPYQGEVGFAAKISRHDGTIIGLVGLGGDPVMTAYAFGRQFWGQGYATEAMSAFLSEVMPRYGLPDIIAGVFPDNPASQRVLEKLGFVRYGEQMHRATSRLEESLLFLYRLRRTS